MKPLFRYSVAVPTMNRPAELRRCLESVLAQRPLPQEIIIVDDGALDREEVGSWLQRFPGRFVYHRKTERGLIASLNQAAQLCREEWLLILDDDIVLEEDFMPRMIEAIEEFRRPERLAGVAGYPVEFRGPSRPWTRWLQGGLERLFLLRGVLEGQFLRSSFCTNYGSGLHPDRPWRVEHVPGGLGLWRTKVLRKYRFDSWYAGYAHGNDKEFAWRVSRKWALLCQPAAQALHLKSPAGRIDRRRLGAMRFRNQHRFYRRHFAHSHLNRVCFGWAVTGMIFILVLSAVISLDRRSRIDELRGILDVVLKRGNP